MSLRDLQNRTAARKAAGANQAYPQHAGKGGRATATALPVLPCGYGTDLTGAEREAAGLGHVKQWKRCDHPERPKGEYVCPCAGCGPSCRGYLAERA